MTAKTYSTSGSGTPGSAFSIPLGGWFTGWKERFTSPGNAVPTLVGDIPLGQPIIKTRAVWRDLHGALFRLADFYLESAMLNWSHIHPRTPSLSDTCPCKVDPRRHAVGTSALRRLVLPHFRPRRPGRRSKNRRPQNPWSSHRKRPVSPRKHPIEISQIRQNRALDIIPPTPCMTRLSLQSTRHACLNKQNRHPKNPLSTPLKRQLSPRKHPIEIAKNRQNSVPDDTPSTCQMTG